MHNLNVTVPSIFLPVFKTDKRFIILYGGRGSGKSHFVATFLLLTAMQKSTRVLCTREYQNSIKDSVHKLLADKIDDMKLNNFFTVKHDSIVGQNGSLFIFKGLARDPNGVKSTEGLDFAWVEEAQSVSRKSLELLTPTIRKEGSKIVFTYNPTNEDDPVHTDYTLAERKDVLKIEANFSDNPFLPGVLRSDMEYCRRVDPDKYAHIWQGKCVRHSDAQVFFGKWSIDDFDTPKDAFFYFGADFGFSQDPTALVRCYVGNNILYIDYEAVGNGIEIVDHPALFDSVPGSRDYNIIGDSSRPETISHMNKSGFKMQGSKKGAGSILEGIMFIRNFEKIKIHPRCKNTIEEFRLYSYVTDKKTGIVSNKIEDAHNHCIDALRYALEPLHPRRGGQVKNVSGW